MECTVQESNLQPSDSRAPLFGVSWCDVAFHKWLTVVANKLRSAKTTDNYLIQLERFRDDYPDAAERIEATIRRCTAVLFLISDASLRSAICELEGMDCVDNSWIRSAKQSALYVVLERSDLFPPVCLTKFWSRVYEPGLEQGLASVIASEIDAQEYKLRLVEQNRAKRFR
jgi:hypothetical protein